MYRLNCHLSDELGARLTAQSERLGMSKVAVVTVALTTYLEQEEMKSALIAKLSDPQMFAEVVKTLGHELPKV